MKPSTESNTLDFRRYLREVKRLWWVYALTLAAFFALAIIFLSRTLPQNRADATMLIEASSTDTGASAASRAGGMAGMMRMFSVGGFGSSSVNNEITLLKSLDLAERTVRAADLTTIYIERKGLSKSLLYPETPIRAALPAAVTDTLRKSFMIRTELLPDGRVNATALRKKWFKKIVFDQIKNAELPATLSTPYGEVTLTKGDASAAKPDGTQKIDIVMSGVIPAAYQLWDDMYASIPDKLSNAVKLYFKGPSDAYCEDVLTEYLNQYNQRRIERRTENARDEVKFYDDRIAEIFGSLSDTEAELEKFKSQNNIVAIKEEAELLVGNAIHKTDEIVAAQTAQDYYKLVKNTLTQSESNHTYTLIPVVESLGNPLIGQYNELLIQRQTLAKSAKEGNVALSTLDEQIGTLRESVLKNIDGLLTENAMRLKAMTALKSTAQSRLTKLPEYERKYITLMRDQTLKNELYMFLLQKRENAAMQMASTTTLGFVIDPPHAPLKPAKTRFYTVMGVALAMGLILPSLLALFLLLWRNRIEDPSDLASIGLEERAVLLGDDTTASLDALRKQVLANQKGNLLLVATGKEVNADAILNSLKESAERIGRKVTILPQPSDNDALLNPAFTSALPTDTLNIMQLPQPQRLGVLELLINADKCELLVILKSQAIKRGKLKSLLRGLYADNIITAIVKR